MTIYVQQQGTVQYFRCHHIFIPISSRTLAAGNDSALVEGLDREEFFVISMITEFVATTSFTAGNAIRVGTIGIRGKSLGLATGRCVWLQRDFVLQNRLVSKLLRWTCKIPLSSSSSRTTGRLTLVPLSLRPKASRMCASSSI